MGVVRGGVEAGVSVIMELVYSCLHERGGNRRPIGEGPESFREILVAAVSTGELKFVSEHEWFYESM